MSQPAADGKSLTFEDALATLESIVRDLEAGETTLEEALGRYEQGVNMLKLCYAQLRQAEQKVYLLSGEGEDGKPVFQPFEPLAPVDPEKLEGRRQPRRNDSSY